MYFCCLFWCFAKKTHETTLNIILGMKKFSLLFVLSIICTMANAQNKIQLRSADHAECVKSDFTSLKASFSFSSIDAEDVTTERGVFSYVSMPNTVIGGNEGEPQIPVVSELIAIPVGAKPTIQVTHYSATDYTLSDFGMQRIGPRQPSLRKDKKPEDVPFVYNESAYQTRGFRSEPQAVVQVVGTMRGVQLGKMAIEPVSYDPVNNTLRVFNDIEVEVSFDGADAKATEQLLVDTYSPYFDVIYKQLFNGRAVLDAYTQHPDLYTTPVKMLVVATSAYQSSTAFQNWLTWKKQKGINVDIYTVTSSTASSTIRSEIQSRYNANHPTFLVIVGDETVVPAYKTNWSCNSNYGNCINDNEYASIDSDVYHDMFMSRMSVSSTTELGNLVNKILTYEKYTMSNPSYLSNSLLVAGWDASWTNRVGKPTIQYANNNYYNSAHGINPTVYITTASGQTAAYNNINNVGFMNYTAHGDIQELADPEFTNSNANSMTNNDKYLWVVANCCLTANWGNNTYKPCLGETMIRAANKGAFGYIGSIPESYWYEDYYFGVGAFSYVASTVQTPSSTTTGMYDAAFDDTGFNTLNSMPYIGNVAVTYAHAAGYTSSVTDEYYWRAYQCLGDGSVMPYLKEPAANTVSHASTINIGATSFQVNAHAGSYVAITKNNEILGVAQADASGVANVPINGLTSAGDVMIVVTRNQRQPYITTIQAISVNGPYITVDSYTPNTANVGEQTNLSLTLKNVGTQATSGNSTVTLSCDNSNLTFGTYTKNFNSLAANASTTVSGFNFTIADGVADGTIIPINIHIANGSNSWDGTANITAVAPNLVVGTITDSELMPGESGTITFPVTNSGSAAAQNVVLTLSCSNSNVTFGTNPVTVSSIAAGASTNVTVNVNVTSNVAFGSVLSFNYTLTANHFSTNGTYNTTAGIMETTIGSGTSTNTYLPTYAYYNYSLSEQIYTPTEIGQACTITAIAFKVSNSKSAARTLDLYMVHTTKSAFSGNSDWVSLPTSSKVFSGSVSFNASGWTTITLDTPFAYDGTSNLIIGVDDNTGSYVSGSSNSPSFYVYSTGANRALYKYNDNTDYNAASMSTSGTRLTSNNQIQLTVIPAVTVELPTVATTAVSDIAQVTATGGGNVSDDGGADVTARGICWSTSHNPTVSGSHTTDGTGTGTFTSALTGLTPNTTYYVRAYATNSEGTAYGSEVSFTTLQAGLVGDADNDGEIAINDVSVLLNHIMGGTTLTGQALLNADVDGDGEIAINDVSMLLLMIMNQK